MSTIITTRSPRSGAKHLALLALVLPSLLAGCDNEPAEPEGFDISLRPAEPPAEPVCITLAPTADAMLSTPPKNQNYGGHPLLRVGGKDESLLRFDLASIPPGASIESATLHLYLNGGAGNNPINIHAATSPWAEGSVTFQSFDQDFDPAVAGIIQPSSPNALKSADVTGLVSSWFLGGLANYGVLLETTGNQKNIFVSREGAAGYRPSLEVCYAEPIVDHCAEAPCQNGGTCENEPGGYTCACAPGYEGVNCETDIDECAGDPCVNGQCNDGIAGYECACNPGWEGTHCETNIDDCAADPCQHGGICTDGLQGYTCTCDAGYTGNDCEIDIDECVDAPCLNGGECTDGINSYTCACQAGFSGANCEINVDDCVGNACEHESTCIDGLAGYDCACLPGFTGTHCEENIDECAEAPCLNGGECNDGINSYDCACPPGYTGDHCEIDIDECESSPCVSGNCVDLVNGWECQCAPGYTGTYCEIEIDECESSPCVNGDCQDQVNGWECACTPGYTGLTCDTPDTPTDGCEVVPCANGATCIDTTSGWTCECLPGWAGPTCEEFVPQGYDCETNNPCTPENAEAGLFYFQHVDPGTFVQCSAFGQCFEMSCGPGTSWNQEVLSCT